MKSKSLQSFKIATDCFFFSITDHQPRYNINFTVKVIIWFVSLKLIQSGYFFLCIAFFCYEVCQNIFCTYTEHLKHSPWNCLRLPPLADTEILFSSFNGNPHPPHISIDTGSDFLELLNITDFLSDAGDSLSVIFLRQSVGDKLLYLCSIGGFPFFRLKAGELVKDCVSKHFRTLHASGEESLDSWRSILCDESKLANRPTFGARFLRLGESKFLICSNLKSEKFSISAGVVTGRGRRRTLFRRSTSGDCG